MNYGKTRRTEWVQRYARIAGVVFLIAFVAGGFGEAYAPSHFIVPGNSAATAQNVTASGPLFRLGFVGYLGESITDVALTFLLYVLLRPVHGVTGRLAACRRSRRGELERARGVRGVTGYSVC